MFIWGFKIEFWRCLFKVIFVVEGEIDDFDDMEVDDVEGGVGWLGGLEGVGLEVEEKGIMDGVFCELLTGAEVVIVVNLKIAVRRG